MDKIKCLIVDDEAVAQRIITKYLEELPEYVIVETCYNAIEANKVLREEEIDLLFLDIEMPKVKGLAFLESLRFPPKVIITTAHREYALEGYELDVVDYLLKPISFERFLKAINKFQSQHFNKAKPSTTDDDPQKIVYIKSERRTIKLIEEDIMYFEGMNNYIIIHTKVKSHIVYMSMSEMIDRLGNQFLRIHKSYVVNKKHVKSFSKEVVEINEKELPIGKSFKEVIIYL